MAKKFLTPIDLTKLELQNAAIHNLATAPSAPSLGQWYLNTVSLIPEYWNGTAWIPMRSGSVTSVEASGGTTGLTFSGGPITTAGTLTLAGTLGVANGGTGATSVGGALTNLGAAASARTLTFTTNNGLIGGAAAVDLTANRSWTFGLTGQALALHNLATNGIIVRTGAGTVTARSIVGGTGISVANGDGVAGNPTISLNANLDALTDVIITTPSNTQVLQYNGTNWVNATIPLTNGTVTSVGLSLPSIFTVSGSPVTTSGTLTAVLASQTAGTFFAAPAALAGAPTFRAMVATDVPNLDAAKITTGIIPVGNGGTGAATLTGIVIGNGASAFTALAGTANQMIRRNAGNTAYEFFTPGTANTIATLDADGKVPLAQLPATVLGQVKYQGTWNASTNTPTLSGTPASTTKGDYYIVTTAGTQFSLSFNIGDWIISDGTSWSKVDNTDQVSTVFGRQGAVVAVDTDYASFYVRHDTAAQGLNTTQQGNARTNINAQVTITGGATTITTANLTASSALVSDASGKVAVSAVTSIELGHLTGVTSAIQTQLNGKFNTPVGTTLQYLRGDGSLATFPTLISQVELNTGTATTERLISAERISVWYATRTFSQTIGDAALTAFNIDHNLNSRDVVVQVYDTTTFEDVEVDITRSTVNRVVLNFALAPALNAYRVVVKI